MGMDLLRNLPKMDVLLSEERITKALRDIPSNVIKKTAQECLDNLRDDIINNRLERVPSLTELAERIISIAMENSTPSLKKVINATGIVLHTNLGRAPLGTEVTNALSFVTEGYCNLEYDLDTGCRSSRYVHVDRIICQLTGAEAALVVNNNAAAVFLMLNTLAKGKNVAISRGELVEIGGSFRIPDIMVQSGSNLIEVGTTNKTRLSDYRSAIEDKDVSVLLKIHKSNFTIVGFTEETTLSELAKLAQEKGIPLLEDLGSCFIVKPPGLEIKEGITAKESIEAGADVVCFSGDKLLGSSQAGIIIGREKYIELMKKNPFTRMFRPDKLSLVSLEKTLRLYYDPKQVVKKLPVMAMLSANPEELKQRAKRLAESLRIACGKTDWKIEVNVTSDETGGGSLPGVLLNGYAVEITPTHISVNWLEKQLRCWQTPIIARICKEKLIISLRTVLENEEAEIIAAFKKIAGIN